MTANKQLLSRHGEELSALAATHGVHLGFEAAVAGVVPVIRVLRESLAGAHIDRIHGIVNGTTNFILSEMARTGCGYEEALAQAQELGYAEADPTEDVGGADAAAKMAILARLAFDAPVHIDDVRYDGITQLTGADIAYARELGLSLKLIGTAERLPDGISVRVHPTFLAAGHPLASVGGSFNAVTVESEAITEITMSGPGAGRLADRERGARRRGRGDRRCRRSPRRPLERLPIVEDVTSAFYVHMEVDDRPGVLAQIAGSSGRGGGVDQVGRAARHRRARAADHGHPSARPLAHGARPRRRSAASPFVRSAPRAISVIDEEFE